MNIAKSLMLVALVGLAGVAGAQSPVDQPANNHTSWIVYKPINRISNKQLFESHWLNASHRYVVSPTYPNAAMTKAVHRAEEQGEYGNVVSKGYPTWTISKPIHRK
ncbi:MAG: hypothetical protein DIU61_015205 [Bacteroidota bacterium]|jgi:hypothetical protein|nr:MAG: hypothetical protein DIU61_11885 [Bacteroidota bacterium]